jgi:hypothetical protein
MLIQLDEDSQRTLLSLAGSEALQARPLPTRRLGPRGWSEQRLSIRPGFTREWDDRT